MPWKEPEHSEPTQPIQRQRQSVVETQKKDTNTRLNIHPKVGEIAGSGQLASRNSFLSLPPSQRLVSTEGSPFVCQPHSFTLRLTPFCVEHMLTHFFKFLHEQVALLQLPFLFLSSLCTPVSTHMSRHPHTYASAQPSHEPPSFSLVSARAISLTDVIVSPAGVLSVTEVGASECV